MKKNVFIVVLILGYCFESSAQSLYRPSTGGASSADELTTVTTSFDGNLSGTDTDVQAALDTLDDVVAVSESSVVAVLDGATLTAATVAATDKVLVQDADDSDNLKTVTAQSIADLGGGGGATDYTTTQTSSTVDGASNNAFDFQADENFTLGNVLRVGDAGNADLFSLDGSGDITTSYLQTDNGTGFFQISRSTKILNNLAITGSFSAANGWVTLGGSASSFGSLTTAGSAYLTINPGGHLNLKAPTSASTTLANSQISFSLDEGGNNLIVTAKYSDGTSKTATIAFD